MGQQLEREIASQMQLVNDPASLDYINDMGRAIVAQTEMANLPWEFHIVADPAINAFNIPGGHVYVNTGLIDAVDNAAQLASVMAHEIIHGVERHGTERISKAYGLQAGAAILLGGDPGMTQQIVASLVGGGVMAKFSRADEREADQQGIYAMYQAGYNPDGMASMFEKLQASSRRNPSGVEAFFSSHPLTDERIRDARRRADRLPDRPGLVTRDSRLDAIKGRLARYN